MSKNMRIMRSYDDKTINCPDSIPFSLLSERQAQTNHDQSLTRLNERGGISPNEALWIIERRGWGETTLDAQKAVDDLNVIIKNHEEDFLLKLVNEQAEDEGLWFDAQTAPEAYLQQALRRLHGLIETKLDKDQKK